MPSHEGEEPKTQDEAGFMRLDKRSATRAMAWSVVFAFVSKIIFPFVGLYISGTLGPAQMGIFYIVSRIVQFSEIVRDAGLTQTYIAEPEMTPQKEASYHFVAVVSGLIPLIVLCSTGLWFASTFQIPELAWAVPLVSTVSLLNGFATIPRAKMLRVGQIKESGLLDVIGGGIGLAIAIGLVAVGAGFVALIAQMIIATAYSLVLATAKFPVKSINVRIQAFRDVGRKAMAVLAANGINNIFLFGDQFVIGKALGPTASGLYGIASNVAYRPADFFAFPLTRTLMVAFSQSSVDREKLNQIYARSLSAAIMAVLPIYVFLAIFAPPIVHLLFQHKFDSAAPILSILSLYLSFRVLGNISGHALVPAGKHFLTFWPWLLCLGLTAGLLAWTLPWKQLEPVAWSFTAGAVFVYGTLLVLGLVHCPPAAEDRAKIFKSTFVLALSAAVMLGVWLLPIHEYVRLGLAILLGPLIHLAILGTVLAGNALEYLSRSGPKRLWREL